MIDCIYCRDRKLLDTILSDPLKDVLQDLLPQQIQRGRLRDRGHNFILPNVCTDHFKNAFYKETSYIKLSRKKGGKFGWVPYYFYMCI